jgi:hypothetical protein
MKPEEKMSDTLTALKAKLQTSPEAFTKDEVEWLVKRIESLESENDWLKKELQYLEYQGEVDL